MMITTITMVTIELAATLGAAATGTVGGTLAGATADTYTVSVGTFASIVATSVTLTSGIIAFLVRLLLRSMREKADQKYAMIDREVLRAASKCTRLEEVQEKCVVRQTNERRRELNDVVAAVNELRRSLSSFRDRWDTFHSEYQRKSATTSERVNAAIKAIDTISLELKTIETRVPKQLDKTLENAVQQLHLFVREQLELGRKQHYVQRTPRPE